MGTSKRVCAGFKALVVNTKSFSRCDLCANKFLSAASNSRFGAVDEEVGVGGGSLCLVVGGGDIKVYD
jgi:hypothetical protein